MNNFGNKIRTLRLSKNVIARHVAAAIDIDQGSYSKLELGNKKPTEKNIADLAKFFRVPIKELKAAYLSDRFLAEITDKEAGLEALKLAEEQLQYTPKSKKKH